MIQLSGVPNIQVQVGEAIAVVAEADFPYEWVDLVDVSISLSASSRLRFLTRLLIATGGKLYARQLHRQQRRAADRPRDIQEVGICLHRRSIQEPC